jgi:dihydrofolate reductase
MIKPFIIAAMTADGFIAKNSNHPATWTSKEDKKHFVEITKRAGVVVMGSSTFKTFPKPLKDRLNIVYSRHEKFEGVEVTEDEPRALLAKLEARGFKEVAICGGTQIYTMFMKAGVVDKLYLTIEPIIFGQGLSLFGDEFSNELTLLNETKTEKGTLMLEYKVK